jgi:hypothetical protein
MLDRNPDDFRLPSNTKRLNSVFREYEMAKIFVVSYRLLKNEAVPNKVTALCSEVRLLQYLEARNDDIQAAPADM